MERDEALKLLTGRKAGIAKWNKWREESAECEEHPDFSGANLSRVSLIKADLSAANLRGADLSGAYFTRANLRGADLSDAQLGEADLRGAELNHAFLRGADVSGADLTRANLVGANFRRANFSGAVCGWTVFADVNLSEATGLELVKHASPSTIGVDTLFRSKGRIPEAFLRGCGVPDSVIANLPSLIGSMSPIQFYTCFISYCTADEEFATRLHNDFQAAGIRCWKWDHNARTGRSLWGEIDEAIRTYDKLVVIASESSLKSPAVNREIERAILQEDERLKLRNKGRKKIDGDVLFPVTLDEYIFKKWKHERKVDVTKKVMANAKGWHSDAGIYAKVRDRLIRDLKTEE
jgi:TIR domain/Pentapeptide repeats (8 copies)